MRGLKESANQTDVKKKSVMNKEGFLMECIGSRTQDTSIAADIAIKLDKVIPGFAHAFPMLWCMYGESEDLPNTGQCYVMRVKDKDIFKIGFSNGVNRRLSQNQREAETELVTLITIPGNFKSEGELHNLFAMYRIDGEWYGGCTMSEYVDIMGSVIKTNPSITVDELIVFMKWRMWFTIEEEIEYKAITFADGLLIDRKQPNSKNKKKQP